MTDTLKSKSNYFDAEAIANQITENVKRIREKTEKGAIDAGRNPDEISIVAVTKTYSSDVIRCSHMCGFDAYGENRVQELLEKQCEGAYGTTPVHMIGTLQSNKVNKVVGKVALVQSVDSTRLARRISKRATELGITQDVLIQVNIAEELTKSGLKPGETEELCAEISEMGGVNVRGLMAIPPIPEKDDSNFKHFLKMHKLLVDIRGKKYDNVSMDILSMGMSGDFEAAIACGSNMIRLGQAIFGARNQ